MWSDERDDTGNNEIKESNRIESNRIVVGIDVCISIEQS